MKIIKELRQEFQFTQKDLASLLQVSQQAVANWESGRARPSIANLRDLAVIFNTSVDVLSDPNVQLKDVAYRWYAFQCQESEVNGGQYFWGHIGLGLPRTEYTKWYPITAHTANRVAESISNTSFDDFINIETLNNRSLYIHKQNIQHIYLLDDNADALKGDWKLGWDSYAGHSPEVYLGLVEKFLEGVLDENEYSDSLQNMINEIIDEHELDEDKVMRLIEYSHIYTVHRDYQHQLSSNSLNEIWMVDFYDDSGHLDLGNLDLGYSLLLPRKSIVLLDVPTHQLREFGKKIEEEEEGEVVRLRDEQKESDH